VQEILSPDEAAEAAAKRAARTPRIIAKGHERNLPCACGSGKKTKHCHGAAAGLESPSGRIPKRRSGRKPKHPIFISPHPKAADNFRALVQDEAAKKAAKEQKRKQRTALRELNQRILRHSQHEANRLAREKRERRQEERDNRNYAERSRAYQQSGKQLYAQWLDGLAPEERARIEAMGLGEAEIDEEIHGAPLRDDEDEPRHEIAVEWDPCEIGEEDLTDHSLTDAFCACLAWCAQCGDLVPMGRRLLAMVLVLRPDLVDGMNADVPAKILEEFREATRGFPLEEIAQEFAAPMEWARRAGMVSRVGQRVYAMLYVLRPRFIGSKTLDALGALNNRSRQAVDKDVCHFRDTYRGIRGELMREEEHRLKCQKSQLSR